MGFLIAFYADSCYNIYRRDFETMMKKVFFIFSCFFALSLYAEVSVLSIVDEDKHQTKEDFHHTYEYFAVSNSMSKKCQATRLTSRWFATAAHCVADVCRDKCSIRMDLMDTPVSVFAQGEHDVKSKTKHPIVFIHSGYKKQKMVKDDFALIKLDVQKSPKIYFRRTGKKSAPIELINEKEFFAWLKPRRRATSTYNKALRPKFPPLVDFSVSRNYEIDRKLSVISIFDGVRNVEKATSSVYYVKNLGYAYTTNFGIRKGMSGSGVMSNTGELMGIISANVEGSWYRNGKKVTDEKLFMFPVFDASIISFMQNIMGSDFNKIDRKDAEPSFVRKTNKDFSSVENIMKEISGKMSKK